MFPAIPSSYASLLSSDISSDEVKNALFAMKPLKSPGIDGLHAMFFQSQWNVVGPSLTKFVQDLWKGEPLDPFFNRTLISLVPKVPSASSLKDFRPISLCSIVYKLVTKTISNRLKDLMPSLISHHQTSFVHGHSIIDNIIISQEVVHSMRIKKGKGGWMAIKIDLEKTFDRLRW